MTAPTRHPMTPHKPPQVVETLSRADAMASTECPAAAPLDRVGAV
ncbi:MULTISPECIES: hypothetical protein [Rhodococcus]|uniref:Uncharacterized protein n=1 Tax=Rhodococcus parequi TaxID=3137122 RepID=A0ABW9FIM5_9NOCA